MKRTMMTVLLILAAVGGLFAQGMMGGGYSGRGMMGGGMMGSWDFIPPDAQEALTIEQAGEQAQKYLKAWGDDNLSLSEVMEFSNHFYIEIAEAGSKHMAFELLMNKYTGAVFPEPGPNMMWNLKYGHLSGGMMSGLSQPQNLSAPMSVTPEKARESAQRLLDSQKNGLKVETDGVDQFYGYYTFHVLKDGQTFGMLGVNGTTGQVWYHTWHGKFLQMKDYGMAM